MQAANLYRKSIDLRYYSINLFDVQNRVSYLIQEGLVDQSHVCKGQCYSAICVFHKPDRTTSMRSLTLG